MGDHENDCMLQYGAKYYHVDIIGFTGLSRESL